MKVTRLLAGLLLAVSAHAALTAVADTLPMANGAKCSGTIWICYRRSRASSDHALHTYASCSTCRNAGSLRTRQILLSR